MGNQAVPENLGIEPTPVISTTVGLASLVILEGLENQAIPRSALGGRTTGNQPVLAKSNCSIRKLAHRVRFAPATPLLQLLNIS